MIFSARRAHLDEHVGRDDRGAHRHAEAARQHGVEHRRAQAVVVPAREDPGDARLVEVVAAQLGLLAAEERAVHRAVQLVPAVPVVGGAVDRRFHARRGTGRPAAGTRRSWRRRADRPTRRSPARAARARRPAAPAPAHAAPRPPAASAATRCAARRFRSRAAAPRGRRRCPAVWAASRCRPWRTRPPAAAPTSPVDRFIRGRFYRSRGRCSGQQLVERDVVEPEVERP